MVYSLRCARIASVRKRSTLNFSAFLLSILCVGAISISVFAESSGRREEGVRVAKEFADLHFFADGRGMMLSPGLISAYKFAVPGLGLVDTRRFRERWGVAYNDEGKISGLHNVEYRGHRVGVMGCVACHSGRAAGQFVVGLGNKNIDVFRLGSDVATIESYWKWFVPSWMKDDTYVDLEEASLAFASYLSNPAIGNLTQGLVPISFIRGWFYRIHGRDLPDTLSRGQVKVPFLWGYGEKRKVGQFCDGYGDGDELGWAIAVELAAGQRPETVRAYYPKVKAAEEALAHLLPPPYPFAIDRAKATRGEQIFAKTCANCHGTYARDAEGLPIYEAPHWFSSAVVMTDRERVEGHSRAFDELVATSPLADILRAKNSEHGYFAPRLEGIWSRFPYLHNGSVPSIAALLTPPNHRPRLFDLRRAGERERFDERTMGLTTTDAANLSARARSEDRDVYDVGRIGHSNEGHDFLTDLPEDHKFEIIEYLKTL